MHWVAVRSIGGQIWFLDSQEKRPSKMRDDEYRKFLLKRRAAYPIVWAEDMKKAGVSDEVPPASGASSSQDGSAPVLPLTRQDTADSSQPVDSQDNTASFSAADEHTLGDTAVPALMVAELHGRALSCCQFERCTLHG
jgi:hypothetical protein